MPQNPIDYLRGLLVRRQPTLGCIAPDTVTAPHGTVEHVVQLADAMAEACQAARKAAPDVDRARPAWTSPDPVEDGPTSGYSGGSPEKTPAVPEPDQPEADTVGRLPKSAEPGPGPTFVYDEPPTPYRGLSLRDDRADLSHQRPVPPSRLADPDPLADQTEPFVAGWALGSQVGIPQYPNWRSGR